MEDLEVKKAPEFTLLSEAGEEVSLKQFLGKKVVLYFYPKDETPGCTQEAIDFQKHLSLFKKKNTVILGVSADSIESHKKFSQKYQLEFSLLSDLDHQVCKKYGVWKEKNLYGKKKMGIERASFLIGQYGDIQKIF